MVLVDETATQLTTRNSGTYQLSYSGREVDEAVGTIVEGDIQVTHLSQELVDEIKTWGGGGTVVDPELENRVVALETSVYKIDYATELSFDTTEIVINTATDNTNSMLGYAVLGQLVLA